MPAGWWMGEAELVEIVLSTQELGHASGAATYLITVSEQLQRLGHGVTVFAMETGELADQARRRGLRVTSSEADLPPDCDLVYAQDGVTAYLLADRYPGRPLAVCMHAGGATFDRWNPPQLPGVAVAVVVLHDDMDRRARAFAHVDEVVRLRQPVDLARFSPLTPLADRPRRALLLGNYLTGQRERLVADACREAGCEPTRLGRYGSAISLTPEDEINRADVVIGQGRVIVEAMACGRAAFVYDHAGGDGWVTPESHAGLEARNFAGTGGDGQVVLGDLAARLSDYEASMGSANRDLARLHHAADDHAEELVEALRGLTPGRPPEGAPLREMARLVRVQWQTEARAADALHELRREHSRAQEAEERLAELAAREQALRATARYRLAGALARPLDWLRRRR